MRRRILVAILSITGVAVLLFGIPLSVVVDRLVEEDATLRSERQAGLAAREIPADYATASDPIELPRGADGVSLGYYNLKGALVAGTGPLVADGAVRHSVPKQIATEEDARAVVVTIPVASNETVIGVICGQQSTSKSDGRPLRIIALVASLALAVIGIGAAIALFVAGRLAARPADFATQRCNSAAATPPPRCRTATSPRSLKVPRHSPS